MNWQESLRIVEISSVSRSRRQVSEEVVLHGVLDEIKQIVNGSFLCDQSLHVKAQPRHHCKTTILHLLHFQILESCSVFGQAKRIEQSPAWVVYVAWKKDS